MKEEWIELEKQLEKEIEESGGKVETKGEFTTYRTIQYTGILGDFATEWWDEDDWNEYREEIRKLKEVGEYGKPHIIELTIKHCPLFDNKLSYNELPLESHRMVFLDMSNYNTTCNINNK
jgi:hypothetical protein